jgi:predicted HTH domain antitoxin
MTTKTDNLVRESIDILSKSRYYGSKDKLLDEAVRTLLEVKPALRAEIAIELYKKGTISLSRGSEIAGVSTEGFKEILAGKGISRVIKGPSREKIRKEVKLILSE